MKRRGRRADFTTSSHYIFLWNLFRAKEGEVGFDACATTARTEERPDFDAPFFRQASEASAKHSHSGEKERPRNRASHPPVLAGIAACIHDAISEHQREPALRLPEQSLRGGPAKCGSGEQVGPKAPERALRPKRHLEHGCSALGLRPRRGALRLLRSSLRSPNLIAFGDRRILPSLRSALTSFGGYVYASARWKGREGGAGKRRWSFQLLFLGLLLLQSQMSTRTTK